MKKSLPRAMRRAFTLVEVLVAVVILVLVIGAITAVESGNIKTSTSGKFQVQANGLAVGATNIVKQIADKLQLGGTIDTFATKYAKGVYYLDNNDVLQECSLCRDKTAPITDTGTLCSGITNFKNTTKICVDPGATKTVDNKDFNRTVIIP